MNVFFYRGIAIAGIIFELFLNGKDIEPVT
jgi:hypothetical protein